MIVGCLLDVGVLVAVLGKYRNRRSCMSSYHDDMTIQYSCIARGATILCSHQDSMGNYEDVASSMLPNISDRVDTKTTYTSNEHQFHTLISSGVVYMCAAEPAFGKRIPYAFLAEIQRLFASGSLVQRADSATSHELDSLFSGVLSTEMARFSSGQGDGQLSQLRGQVEGVRDVMSKNIDKVLDRGERIEDLMDKTTDLETNAAAFQTTARRVKRKYWWRNIKMMIILGVVIVVVLIIVIIIILYSTGVLPPGDKKAVTTTTTTAKP